MSIPSLSDTFRTYIRFATQKLKSDEHGVYEVGETDHLVQD